MFNKELIGKLKKGVLIVNNARGAIMERQAVVDAVESGHIGGYSGDVWDPQPAPKDHPWRYMPNQAMTPHTSGTTIDAQVILFSLNRYTYHMHKFLWKLLLTNEKVLFYPKSNVGNLELKHFV